jgi:hypothetical protein
LGSHVFNVAIKSTVPALFTLPLSMPMKVYKDKGNARLKKPFTASCMIHNLCFFVNSKVPRQSPNISTVFRGYSGVGRRGVFKSRVCPACVPVVPRVLCNGSAFSRAEQFSILLSLQPRSQLPPSKTGAMSKVLVLLH